MKKRKSLGQEMKMLKKPNEDKTKPVPKKQAQLIQAISSVNIADNKNDQ